MKPILKDDRGAILIFELVVLAVVLVVAGFAVYQYSLHKNATNKVITPKPHIATKASPSPSVTLTLSAKPANEFDVTELGFKMTLPNGLKGLTYSAKLNQTGSVGGTSYTFSDARFSSQSLEQAGGSKYCSSSDAPIGDIAEYSFDPEAAGIMDISKVRKVGDHYLAFSGPQAACSTSSSANNLETSLIPLLMQAFDSATPL